MCLSPQVEEYDEEKSLIGFSDGGTNWLLKSRANWKYDLITQKLINMLLSWCHSGFNVFCGPRIHPREEDAMENLARYIIRASFSQERMTYIREESKVIYKSKDGRQQKAFDALEWPCPVK